MNNLLDQMQKWTPFAVGVLLIIAVSLAIAVYCVISRISPPDWDIAILFSFGSLFAGTNLISHGVTIANGVAKDTAHAVVSEAVSQGLTNGTQEEHKNA